MTIVPSVIAKDQAELTRRLAIIPKTVKRIQLDVMDGVFVKARSLDFDFDLPKRDVVWEADLMMADPKPWIERNASKVDVIIVHLTGEDLGLALALINKKGKRTGIALDPDTLAEAVRDELGFVDHATVMTVVPGGYGAPFIQDSLEKVRRIRRWYPDLDIEVDGGMSDKTLPLAKQAGANLFVAGSFIQNAKDPLMALKRLEALL
ncbi:MAG: hypothetical protein ABIH41_04005 [Nanoarchaeota archaeon]